MPHIGSRMLDRELKKGSAELLILSLVEDQPRHECDIGMHIERQSKGTLRFNVASLYPLLYRLEKRGWIQGRWVEKAGQRRRRYYRLTAEGKKGDTPHPQRAEGKRCRPPQRMGGRRFVEAISRITGIEHA